jgi:phosphoketolase
VFEARDTLEQQGYRVRIVCVANPRRLYRPDDVAWDTVSQADGKFMGDAEFDALFGGDILIGVTGGASGALEPVMLRSQARRRDVMCWKRGETTASPGEIMAFNGLSAADMIARVNKLAGA